MSLTKEFNALSQKRRAAAETESWSETHHISRYFCAVAARRKLQEVEKVVTVQVPAPQQTIVRLRAPRGP